MKSEKILINMVEEVSIKAYNNPERAIDYHTRTGFDPDRKAEMLDVTLNCLIDLTQSEGVLLELGAGSGLFSKQVIEREHFSDLYLTDGAERMLEIAKVNLTSTKTNLHFDTFDFTALDWSKKYETQSITAVTSSMAIHHATNKQLLYKEVYKVLESKGVFVFADHIAGTTPVIDKLIGTKRAKIKLGQELNIDDAAVKEFIIEDKRKQLAEGNACESPSDYLNYLKKAGFTDVDCVWRDHWLAVFIAIKN